jgi:hypothetical protein
VSGGVANYSDGVIEMAEMAKTTKKAAESKSSEPEREESRYLRCARAREGAR